MADRDVHSLIELVWHLLSTGEVYKDLGDDYFTNRQDPDPELAACWHSSRNSAMPSRLKQAPP